MISLLVFVCGVGTGLRTADVVVATREELSSAIAGWPARDRPLPGGRVADGNANAARAAGTRPARGRRVEREGEGDSRSREIRREPGRALVGVPPGCRGGMGESLEGGGVARGGERARGSHRVIDCVLDLCCALSRKSAEFTRTVVAPRPGLHPCPGSAPLRASFSRECPRVRREQAEDPCHRPIPLQ